MDCGSVAVYIDNFAGCLAQNGMDAGLAEFISLLIGVILVSGLPLVTVILLIWVERKIAARIQDRIGPNRVGPFGLLQTFADMVKLITKEDITPTNADRLIYNAAPLLSFASVVLIWAVVPFTRYHIGVDLEIGLLYIFAVASLGTLAVMAAGWASNNKYALLGAFRVVAQLISYEVPLVFSALVPIMLAGTMSMQGIVEAQWGMWFIFMAPLSAVLFFISAQAETGRAPFDLLEAESELVAGFNIEYSGMKFGLFFAAEFLHVFTNAVLMAALFFGGWLGPGAQDAPLLAFFYLGAKASVLYFISLLIRNTLPRVRIDQLMAFNWKFLVPLSIINVILMAFLLKVMQGVEVAVDLTADGVTLSDAFPMTIVLLLANIAMFVGVIGWVRNQFREMRLAEQEVLEELAAAGASAGH